jgi:hypothetical protein
MSRTKDQWLEKTGGFRFGETQGDFVARTARIQALQAKKGRGALTAEDINELARLLGKGEADEDDG